MSADRGSVVAVREGEERRGGGRAVERWESFKMAAIRDGLGRVRVAGEAIYQSWWEREGRERSSWRVASTPMMAVTTPLFSLSLSSSRLPTFLSFLSLSRLRIAFSAHPRSRTTPRPCSSTSAEPSGPFHERV